MGLVNGYESCITREEYRKIRRLDRRQMDEYLGSLYSKAYDAGFSEECKVGKVDAVYILESELLARRGIGRGKALEILNKACKRLNLKGVHM